MLITTKLVNCVNCNSKQAVSDTVHHASFLATSRGLLAFTTKNLKLTRQINLKATSRKRPWAKSYKELRWLCEATYREMFQRKPGDEFTL